MGPLNRRHPEAPRRGGFALVVVLWTLTGMAAVALVLRLAAREAIEGAVNQVAATRAYWAAEQCAAQLLATGTDAVIASQVDLRDPQRGWRLLDRLAPPIAIVDTTARCVAALESNGARLDINRATAADLAALLGDIGIAPPARDSLVDALLDWRDVDDLVRPAGAEQTWYAAQGRPGPRNGPLANPLELRRIAGFDHLSAQEDSVLRSLVAVDADLVDLSHASRPVLETLPGVSPWVADAILANRERDTIAPDLLHLMAQLPLPARDSIADNYTRLLMRATTSPAHWVLEAEGRSGAPAIQVHLELLLAAGNGRVGIVRRRFWME